MSEACDCCPGRPEGIQLNVVPIQPGVTLHYAKTLNPVSMLGKSHKSILLVRVSVVKSSV